MIQKKGKKTDPIIEAVQKAMFGNTKTRHNNKKKKTI